MFISLHAIAPKCNLFNCTKLQFSKWPASYMKLKLIYIMIDLKCFTQAATLLKLRLVYLLFVQKRQDLPYHL